MVLARLIVSARVTFQGKHRENLGRIEDEVAQFQHRRTQEALTDAFRTTVNEYAQFLPVHIVCVGQPLQLRLADYLGTDPEGISFYRCQHQLFSTKDSLAANSLPILQSPFDPKDYTEEQLGNILGLMRDHLSAPSDRVYRIPTGYFIFTFQAQWAIGGEEEKNKVRQLILSSDSVDGALRQLLSSFYGRPENFFWSIFMRTGQGVSQVKAKHPLSGDRELDEICTDLASPYQLFV